MIAGTALLALAAQTVAYELELQPEPAPGALLVELRVEGARDEQLSIELDGFGEWHQAEHEHLLDVRTSPGLRAPARGETVFAFEPPAGWDGSAQLSYRIPLLDAGSEAAQRHGLLPRRAGAGVEAIAINVLPGVRIDGAPAPATVALRAPEDQWWVTGWADPARGALDVAIERVDQCPLFVHPAPRIAEAGEGDARVVVAQLSPGADVRAPVLEIASATVRASARATGVPRPGLLRLFVRGEETGVSGGMRSDHGLVLAWNPDTGATHWRHGVAHEVFHEWLPGRLPSDGPPLVFFFEGFTQYLSLLCAARGGVIDADAFAERLLELEGSARASEAFGRVAFGDPAVGWRDGDGPLETLAYDGGALLAFEIDRALRAGGTTLAAELGRWMRAERPGYSLERLRAALARAGSGDAVERLLERPFDPPPLAETLAGLGFFDREGTRAAYVTYLGVETDAGLGPGRVLAIDPEGPQAARDLRPGDRILDYGPRRTGLALAADRAPGRFACGLCDLVPFLPADGHWAEIERDGERLRVTIEPWLQPGGVETVRLADPRKARAFFDR